MVADVSRVADRRGLDAVSHFYVLDQDADAVEEHVDRITRTVDAFSDKLDTVRNMQLTILASILVAVIAICGTIVLAHG